MEWIGFITAAIVLSIISLSWAGAVFMWMGEYNIGDVPNTWKHRVAVLAAGGVLMWLWATLYEYAPFSVVVKGA